MLELLGAIWDLVTGCLDTNDNDYYADNSLSQEYLKYLEMHDAALSSESTERSAPAVSSTPAPVVPSYAGCNIILGQMSNLTPVKNQKECSSMAHATYYYKGHSYAFVFEYTYSAANGYRAYIVSAPGYGRCSDSLHSTHRLRDGSRYYICWSDKITTVAQMDAVAELWSKATVMYIANGGSSLDQYAEKILRAESSG